MIIKKLLIHDSDIFKLFSKYEVDSPKYKVK